MSCVTISILILHGIRSLINLPKIRSVDVDPSDPDGDRLVLLRVSEEGMNMHCPSWHATQIDTLPCKSAELSPEASQFLKAETNGLVPYTINLDYDYWTAGRPLHILLPYSRL